MTGRPPADNRTLAEQARSNAALQAPGSLSRRAWGCVAVALSTTRTLTGARRALSDIRAADVRQAAADALDRLTEEGRP